MKLVYAVPLLLSLAACGTSYPGVQTPDLEKPKISMLFNFPEGSNCRVNTSQGALVIREIPGKIDFPQSDRLAPASCDLPSGQRVNVTAHNFVPANNSVAGITVYPDGSAYITSSTTDGQLVRLEPTGTVQ